jgi:hypothetical protein
VQAPRKKRRTRQVDLKIVRDMGTVKILVCAAAGPPVNRLVMAQLIRLKYVSTFKGKDCASRRVRQKNTG